MLDYWFLVDSSSLSSGGVSINAITEGKNVFVLLVLKSVRINSDQALIVGQTSINQLLLRFASRVDDG